MPLAANNDAIATDFTSLDWLDTVHFPGGVSNSSISRHFSVVGHRTRSVPRRYAKPPGRLAFHFSQHPAPAVGTPPRGLCSSESEPIAHTSSSRQSSPVVSAGTIAGGGGGDSRDGNGDMERHPGTHWKRRRRGRAGAEQPSTRPVRTMELEKRGRILRRGAQCNEAGREFRV